MIRQSIFSLSQHCSWSWMYLPWWSLHIVWVFAPLDSIECTLSFSFFWPSFQWSSSASNSCLYPPQSTSPKSLLLDPFPEFSKGESSFCWHFMAENVVASMGYLSLVYCRAYLYQYTYKFFQLNQFSNSLHCSSSFHYFLFLYALLHISLSFSSL